MAEPFVFNRKMVLDRLGGDEEILDMMIEAFLEDCESNCQKFEAAWQEGVSVDIAREAHTVKGLLATVSDDQGAADALVMEHAAKQGNVAGMDELARSLAARLREVAAVLTAGY